MSLELSRNTHLPVDPLQHYKRWDESTSRWRWDYEKLYTTLLERKKEDPKKTREAILLEMGVPASLMGNIYAYRSKMKLTQVRSLAPSPSMQTIEIPDSKENSSSSQKPKEEEKLVILLGKPEEVQKALSQLNQLMGKHS